MKSIFIIFSVLFFAQVAFAQKFSIGTHTGFGAAGHQQSLSAEYGQYYKVRPVTSFAQTFDVATHFNQRFSLISGITAESKGVERYYTVNRYFYVTVPVSLRYQVIQSPLRPWSWYIQGGLYGARAAGQTQRNNDDYIGLYDIYLPEFAEVEKVDYGWNAATGVLFKINNKFKLDMQMYFSHGLKDMYGRLSTQRLSNVALQLRGGVEYSF